MLVTGDIFLRQMGAQDWQDWRDQDFRLISGTENQWARASNRLLRNGSVSRKLSLIGYLEMNSRLFLFN